MGLKLKFQISREKLELYYSISLILLIPALLAFNTLYLVNATKRDMDAELRKKANLANEIFGAAIAGQVDDPNFLQSAVDRVEKYTEEISELNILLPQGDDFYLAASTQDRKVNSVVKDVQSSLVWTTGRPVATLSLVTKPDEPAERVWKVLTPIENNRGKIVGLLDLSVSLKDVDALTSNTFRNSLVVLVATILAIVLLMLNHFRFVGYAVLVKKMSELDQMKNDFISVATHELKTPMTIIKGYISNVIDGVSGKVDDKGKETLTTALDATNRLNALVADLLDVSRLEQGRTKFDIKPVDLVKELKQIVKDQEIKAKEKGLVLKYDPPAGLPFVLADGERVKQIFTNLLNNAIKYTEKGEVTILHEVERDKLKTTVKDTGIGMSAKERENLFQRFYRIRNDKTQNISGTGLGLWITKEYVTRMKGEIYVDSLEGVGSQFTVVFPAIKNLPPAESSAPAESKDKTLPDSASAEPASASKPNESNK